MASSTVVTADSAPPTRWPKVVPLEWTRPDEAIGRETRFTTWLSERVDVLEAALGLEGIEVVGTEVDVEGKRLDILAAALDPAEGGKIALAIEAQYGRSDHDHLGKLLTYAAGAAASYDRVLCVWLVDEVEPAHLAAIELLNSETSERLGFVLARIRFVKSGTEEWSYDVHVVVRPNEFIRNHQALVSTGNAVKRDFATAVRELATESLIHAGFGHLAGPDKYGYEFWAYWPTDKRWHLTIRSGKPDDGFAAFISVDGYRTTAENESVLTKFREHADAIEATVGTSAQVNWQAHLNSTAKYAAFARVDWPGIGYETDPQAAADCVIAFAQAVAKAATVLQF